MKVKLLDFRAGGKCDLFHYGILNDYSDRINLTLESGHLYGVIGEFGEGGAAISYGLSGRLPSYEGSVWVNDSEVKREELRSLAWYVGYDIHSPKESRRLYKHSIESQVKEGIAKAGQPFSVKEVQNMFKISDERFSRNIKYVSGERYKASAAIGYAFDKQIFCFPWMNSRDLFHQKEHITNIVSVLLKANKIVLLPTAKKEMLAALFDDFNLVDLSKKLK